MQVARSRLVELLKALHVDSVDGWNNGKLAVRVNQDNGIVRYSDTPEPFPPGSEFQSLFSEIVADQAAGNAVEVLDDTPVETEVAAPTANGKPKKAATAKKSPQKTPAKPPASKSGKTQKHVGKKNPTKPKAKTPGKPVGKAPVKAGKKHVKRKRVPTPGKVYAVSTDPTLTWKQRLEGWKKKPYELTGRGQGVVRTIVNELKQAGKGYAQKKHKPVTKSFLHGVLVEKFPDRDGAKMWKTLNNQVPTQLRQYRGIHVWHDDSETDRRYFIVGDGDKPQPETTNTPASEKVVKPKKKAKSKAKKPAKASK